jgi:hypothetical protein
MKNSHRFRSLLTHTTLVYTIASCALAADPPPLSRSQVTAKLGGTTQVSSPSQLQSPILGFLASNTPVALRPIFGVPGAVVLGDPLALPGDITRVTMAPNQQYALVERNDASEMGLLPLTVSGTGDIQTIAGSLGHADRIAFSPSGTSAVIYSAASQQLQLLTGLASAAPAVSDMSSDAVNGTPLTALAVSDDAQAVLAGLSDGTNGAVWLLSAQAQAKQLMPAAVPSAIRFLPQSQDAVLADSGWKQVDLLTAVTAQFSSRLLADESQGINAPADVDVTPDSNRVWVADAGGSALLVIDIAAGAVASIDSPFAPSSLLRLAGRSVFLVAAQDATSTGVWAPETPDTGVWRLPSLSNFE